jgi:hypothetical protein
MEVIENTRDREGRVSELRNETEKTGLRNGEAQEQSK